MNHKSRRSILWAALLLLLNGCTPNTPEPTMVFVGGTVFTDPDSPPLMDATLVLKGERIAVVGSREEVQVPRGAHVVDLAGRSVLAGFWNTHVHFTGPVWEDAASRDAHSLTAAMVEMLLRWGFVRVVDTGSVLENTLALRDRIQTREVTGPDILIAGFPFVPTNGNPFYIEPFQVPQFTSADQADRAAAAHFDSGADLLKVFSASPVAPGRTVFMSADILRAATDRAKTRGKLVIAHPTTNDGISIAVQGGVDILAHTTPDGGEPWDEELIASMRAADLAIIPTLTLWKWSLEQQGAQEEEARDLTALAQAQVRAYADAGGSILFGTDVGFISEYNPTREFLLLFEAGLSFPEILRALTTEPVERFGVADTGTIRAGKSADLVILNGRPDHDISAFADVSAVYLRGKEVFQQ